MPVLSAKIALSFFFFLNWIRTILLFFQFFFHSDSWDTDLHDYLQCFSSREDCAKSVSRKSFDGDPQTECEPEKWEAAVGRGDWWLIKDSEKLSDQCCNKEKKSITSELTIPCVVCVILFLDIDTIFFAEYRECNSLQSRPLRLPHFYTSLSSCQQNLTLPISALLLARSSNAQTR